MLSGSWMMKLNCVKFRNTQITCEGVFLKSRSFRFSISLCLCRNCMNMAPHNLYCQTISEFKAWFCAILSLVEMKIGNRHLNHCQFKFVNGHVTKIVVNMWHLYRQKSKRVWMWHPCCTIWYYWKLIKIWLCDITLNCNITHLSSESWEKNKM